MGQIIKFPQQTRKASPVYTVIAESIENAANGLALVRIQMAMTAYSSYITPAETKDLTEKLRAKRLDFAQPKKKPAQVADEPGLYRYTPEMGEQEPQGCQLSASPSHDGKHWYVDSPDQLRGQGIRFVKQYTAADFVAGSNSPRVGLYHYCVTERAFKKLCQQYTISQETFLD